MSTGKRRSKVKLIGLLIIITGALGVVAGGVTLGMVSAELKAERLTIGAMTPAGPDNLGGESAAGSPKAYAPAALSLADGNRVMTLSDSRDSLTNGPFLRALFTIAAIALGVAAPVMGIGVLFALVDLGPAAPGTRRCASSAP
jgi:hypothetical protein